MARVRTGKMRRKRHKKVLKEAKGMRGASGTNFKQANQAVMRGMAYATRDRFQRRRNLRRLWIMRINAAARLNGTSYSKLMFGLKEKGIELDRKVLADMAVANGAEFKKLVDLVKESA